MDDSKKNTNEWAIQHGEILQSYNRIRPLRSSLKWTSYLARDKSGTRAILTYIDRERIAEHYQIAAYQKGTAIEAAKAEAARYVEEYEKNLIDSIERIKGLGNAHVATTHGWSHDKERDQIVIISEYVPGVDLAYASQTLNPKQLIYIFAQVLDGLSFIHQCGFLHLNVKPSRIHVDVEADIPCARLTNFGLAVPMKGFAGEYAGTALYMAPEAILNQRGRIDARADLYSLGVTMYNALTGRQPLEHRMDAKLDKQRLAELVKDEQDVTTPPTHYNRSIPTELNEIILGLLRKEPEKRAYNNADDLTNAFKEYWPKEIQEMSPDGMSNLSSFGV